MNLGTMKTALIRYAGVDTTDPLVDWINAALHEFEDAYDWPFLEAVSTQNTVANNDTLAVPVDLLRITTAKITVAGGINVARRNLNYVPRVAYENSEKYNNLTPGEPCEYTLVGNSTMILWPVPNAVYTVRFFYDKTLADLAIDANVPDMPSKYHYTIVEGAAVRALQAESEEERAQTARGIFEDSIDRHITKIGGRKQGGQLNTVTDAMGYGS